MPSFKKIASTSKNRRHNKEKEANQAACECIVLGTMGTNDKPEALCSIRDPVLIPLSLDQFRRVLKRNFLEIENEEERKYCNSMFACFHVIVILIWMI